MVLQASTPCVGSVSYETHSSFSLPQSTGFIYFLSFESICGLNTLAWEGLSLVLYRGKHTIRVWEKSMRK
jgi:hypothetical protein